MPRKAKESLENIVPGPISVELRVGVGAGEKVHWRQRTYSYEIDQNDPAVTVIRCFHRPQGQLEAKDADVEAPVVDGVE